MTFTEEQQKDHRDVFIRDCRQKAWSSFCHAEWIAKNLDGLLAQMQKLQGEDQGFEAQIKELEGAIDAHTKDNREKRRALQEKRSGIARTAQVLGSNYQQGQQALQSLYQAAESALELAKHAEGWSWKEVEAKSDDMADAHE